MKQFIPGYPATMTVGELKTMLSGYCDEYAICIVDHDGDLYSINIDGFLTREASSCNEGAYIELQLS